MTQFFVLIGVAFGVMAFTVAAMAVGVMFTGREIKGSCGGVGGADCSCSGGRDCASARGSEFRS